MEYRFLGETGIKVSELAMGTWAFGGKPMPGRPGRCLTAAGT